MRAQIRESLAPLAIIFGAVIFYFGRALLPGQTIYANDMDMAYSAQTLLANSLHNARLPLWDATASSGIPFFVWMPVFYLPQLVLAVAAPINSSFAWGYIFHLMLAGVGMYWLLKEMELATLGAMLGALIYMFNGYMILRIFAGHFMYVYAAAWIPLVFYFAERILRAQRFRDAAAGGIALGMQFLVALTQLSLYTLVMLVIYLLVRWTTRRGQIRTLLVIIGLSGLMCLIGIGIGAGYWLPTFASVATSMRSSGLEFATAAAGSLPPTHIVNLVFPHLFGSDLEQNYWGYFLGYVSPIESGMYLGILPLGLGLFALRAPKRSHVIALTLLGAGALIFSLGRFTPVYHLAYDLIPGWSTFRIPARMTIFICFALAALAGHGLDMLANERPVWTKRLAVGWIALGTFLFCVFLSTRLWNPQLIALSESFARAAYANVSGERTRSVEFVLNILRQAVPTLPDQFIIPSLTLLLVGGLFIALQRAPRLARTLLVASIVIDLFFFGWHYLIVVPTSDLLNATQREMLVHLSVSPETGRVFAADNLLPTNLGNVFGFANVQSDFPQALQRYRDLFGYTNDATLIDQNNRRVSATPHARTFQLLNVTTAFTLEPIDAPGWRERARAPVEILAYNRAVSDYPIPQTATAYVYENTNPLPRVFIVYDARVLAADAAALAAIYRTDFDPARQVILDQPVGALGPAPITSAVQMQSYAPTRLELTVTTDAPGIVVLSEIYAPGWSARVDDHPVPILRANYALRGIYVSAGAHRVELVYLPPRLIEGLALTGLTLVVILIGVGIERYREKRGI
jgi:hypothetical protein